MATLSQRASGALQKATAAAGQHDFPALFTIEGSARHELLLVNPGHDIDQLKQSMVGLIAKSPNTAEPLHQYKSKETKDTVKQIRVKWASEGRDKQLFPRETILTDDNCEAVLRMMSLSGSKDVFDIRLESQKA